MVMGMIIFKRLQTKIFVYFIILVLIPLLCLGTFSYVIATKFLEEQLVQHQTQTIGLVAGNIKSILDDAKDITSYIASNETLQTLLSQPKTDSLTHSQKVMFDYLSNLKNAKSFISFLVVYGENGFVLGDFTDHYRQMVSYEELKNSGIYNATAAKDGQVHWESSSSALFIYGHNYKENMIGRRIVSIYDRDQKLGMLFMGLKRESMDAIIANIKIGTSTNIFLFDDNYNLVASKRQDNNIESTIEQNLILKKQILNTNQTAILRLNDKDYFVSSATMEPYKWNVVSLTPLGEVRTQHEIVLRITLISSLSLLLLVGLISAFLSRSITLPVKNLLRSMNNFKRGDFNQKVEVSSQDEIGTLSQKYNEVVVELNELIQKVYISQTHQKMIELKTLQAQIEPHFLYNTLDFIFLNSKINGDDQSAEVVHSLSELFRISLNQGKDYYKLENEMNQIKAYIRIQHARFPHRFRPEYDIDPDIEPYYTMKLLLQPIVENALIHAFERKKTQGVLRITGRKLDEKIMLTVEDDGCGMPEAHIRALLSGSMRENGGYGVKNVNERLTMLFGADYSLRIESIEGQGTKVTIYLPLIESEEKWRLLHESYGD
jgi:two-component system sensor histidine kinase YesM